MTHSGGNLFERALRRSELLTLDGGLATELEARGYDIGTRLWSAALLQSNPGAIVAAHRAYFEAGADIAISASYQASVEGFATLAVNEAEAERLIARSVELAHAARRAYCSTHPERGRHAMVAASVGPYGAAQHDGSEYTGRYTVDETALRQFHQRRLAILDQTDADLLACETIPNALEARVLEELLRDTRLPAWVSFCCRDAHCLSDGTPIAEVAALFNGHRRVLAIGINCTAPAHVESLIADLQSSAPDLAIVVYANSGESYDARARRWSGDSSPAAYAALARRWRDNGAAIIGGCCRIGPAEIRQVAAVLHGK